MSANAFPDYDYNQIKQCQVLEKQLSDLHCKVEVYFTWKTWRRPQMPWVTIEDKEYTPSTELSEWNRLEYIIRVLEAHIEMYQEWNKRSIQKS